ncbi:hypothetical protein JOD29_000241 [Lysinibacillus composti]|nr:hypothetical protein [Lysinibacillus composti]
MLILMAASVAVTTIIGIVVFYGTNVETHD